jgi:uncharacterized protein YjbI with pentapeptide repeats
MARSIGRVMRRKISNSLIWAAELANQEHLAILKHGAAAWAKWRKNNPEIVPDLGDTDLSDIDLRDCDLTRANLAGAKMSYCSLQRTQFREATLAGADLASADALLPQQLAGANLERAKLPDTLVEFFKDTKAAKDISDNAQKLFIAMLAACLYSLLTIASTTDASLVTDRASFPLPVIQTSIPIVSFYAVAPLLLLGVFFYCHFYLQKLWEELGSLPAVYPDGKPLQTKADPWLLSDLVQSHVWKLRPDRAFLSYLQAGISVLLAWWSVPVTLLFFWARYLPRHDVFGTRVQAIVAAISITGAVFLYRLASHSLRGRPRAPFEWRNAAALGYPAIALTLLSTVALLAISHGAINGVRTGIRGRDCWPQAAGPASWVSRAMVRLRYSPFADIVAADLAIKPSNWTGKDDSELDHVTGLRLYGADLRYANLNSVFLPVSVLTEAKLDGAELASADLRRTKLTNAHLRRALLDGANLAGADLTGADVEDADFRAAIGLTTDQVKKAKNYGLAFYDDSLLHELGLKDDDQEARLEHLKKEFGGTDWVVCEANQLGNTPGKGEAADTIMAVSLRRIGPMLRLSRRIGCL